MNQLKNISSYLKFAISCAFRNSLNWKTYWYLKNVLMVLCISLISVVNLSLIIFKDFFVNVVVICVVGVFCPFLVLFCFCFWFVFFLSSLYFLVSSIQPERPQKHWGLEEGFRPKEQWRLVPWIGPPVLIVRETGNREGLGPWEAGNIWAILAHCWHDRVDQTF